MKTHHGALEIVTLPVLNNVGNDQNTEEEDHGLKGLEMKCHGLMNDPSQDN